MMKSGGPGRAIDHLDLIKEMAEVFKTESKDILVGSGVTLDNLEQVIKGSGACEFHLGTDVRIDNSCLKGINKQRLNAVVSTYRQYT